MHRNPTTAELVASGEEALTSVAFAEEVFVLGAKLVPESVKRLVVRAMDYVAQPVYGSLVDG